MAMAAGRLLRYDHSKGYGFIAPDGGGEDVFVHANALHGDKFLFRPGSLVEFEVQEGERGLHASSVRVVESAHHESVPHYEPASASPRVSGGDGLDDDDNLCDVLTAGVFTGELTNLFIDEVPSLTGSQIAQLRQSLVKLGRQHGWIEG